MTAFTIIAYEPQTIKTESLSANKTKNLISTASSADHEVLLTRAVQAEAKAETIAGQCDALRIRVDELEAELAVVRKEAASAWAAGEHAVHEAREERDRAKSQAAAAKHFREVLQEIAEGDCDYGDNCPDNRGTRHGTCVACRARWALES